MPETDKRLRKSEPAFLFVGGTIADSGQFRCFEHAQSALSANQY